MCLRNYGRYYSHYRSKETTETPSPNRSTLNLTIQTFKSEGSTFSVCGLRFTGFSVYAWRVYGSRWGVENKRREAEGRKDSGTAREFVAAFSEAAFDMLPKP